MSDGVVDEVAEDDVGEPSFQGTHRLHGGLALGLAAVEVGAARSWIPELDGGHDVQGPVDLAVPGPREPVPDLVAGGGVDECGAVPGRKVVAVGESRDVADLDEQPGCAGGSDAGQVGQVVPVAASSAVSSLFAAFLRAWIRSRSLMSSAATRRRVLPTTSRGRTFPSNALAWAADRSCFAPPGMSSSSKLVQLSDHPGVVLAQRATAVDQDPEHGELLVVDHRTQAGHPGPDQGDRVGVGGVGLASLTRGEDPGPCRQLRWDIDDFLTVCEEPHRDVVPDAAALLDRPDPLRPLAGVAQQRLVAVAVGGEPASTVHGLVAGHHLDRD